MFFIYTLSDPDTNEIRYVGKTTNLKRRYYLHKAESKTSTTHKSRWFAKLLSENRKPLLQILDEVNENDWQFWEKYWINQVKVWGFNLCNLTDGGDGVKIWSDDMRKKMSEVKSGCEVWNKGVPMSDDAKEKLSESKKGKPGVFKGKNHSEKFKKEKSKQMIEFFKNNEHGRIGKKHTEESLKLMSVNARVKKLIQKPVVQYTLEGNYLREWDSVVVAGKTLNIYPSNIRKCCKSSEFYRIVGGFRWKYKENIL